MEKIEKINLFKAELSRYNVDELELLISLSEGINPQTDWTIYSLDELIAVNIEFMETEMETEITSKMISDAIEVELDM